METDNLIHKLLYQIKLSSWQHVSFSIYCDKKINFKFWLFGFFISREEKFDQERRRLLICLPLKFFLVICYFTSSTQISRLFAELLNFGETPALKILLPILQWEDRSDDACINRAT